MLEFNFVIFRLTVEEHIWFYGSLKGMKSEDAKQEMHSMINDIGLPHKRNEYSSKLSGTTLVTL